MMRALLVAAATALLAAPLRAQGGSDVWLFRLSTRGELAVPDSGINVSHRPGYDNQPSFTRDGKRLYFTSARDDGQSDIFAYDIVRGTVSPVTSSPESEYSAQQLPGSSAIGAITVERDSVQRLWRIDPSSGKRTPLFTKLRPVGYWATADARTFAMFVLGSPPALVLGDARIGALDTVAVDIGRSVLRIPGANAFSFTQPGPDSVLRIRRVDAATHAVRDITTALPGSQDIAWLPDGRLLMAKGNTIYVRRPSRGGDWSPLVSFTDPALQHLTRMAVSADGAWLAVVSAEPPAHPVRPEPPTIRPSDRESAPAVTHPVRPEAPTIRPSASESAGPSMPAAAPLVLYIVRHAEKAAPSGDPPLAPAGTARAKQLAEALADAGVRAVIVTSYRRTQETAAPLAAALGLSPVIVPVSSGLESHARAVVDSARAKVGAGAVLVVGHTNTIPAIIEAAGGPRIPEPCDEQYDGLWIVTIPVQGAATLVRARYGTEAFASAECTSMRMKP